MRGNVLVIEDDRYIAELIEFNLTKEGYNVLMALNANEGLVYLNKRDIDVILLDLMLPGLQGEEFLRLIKSRDNLRDIPVIIITAKSQEDLFVKLLNEGADDFLIKPFSIKVLLAKIGVLFRRVYKQGNTISLGGIEMSLDEYSVAVDGKPVSFTKTEFDILKFFLLNPNKVLTRDAIIDEVWGSDGNISDRTIDVHISKIRKKIGSKANLIKSIPRVGYKFSV
ncbi:response regulator transcription factor [Hippea sp. KM1]|uniref:response regulator transcription factor n=1 Tax=Hippea sp. KM1 TaxID=944481 RepID=UPI00046D1C50|nr:response regulator transcription factor [Hippea sp. KM1]